MAFSILWHHHSFFAYSVLLYTVYQMRLIVIDDDIAPVRRTANCFDARRKFLSMFFALVYTNIIKYAAYMDLAEPNRCSLMLIARRQPTRSIVAIVCAPAYSRSSGKWTKFHYRSIFSFCFRHQRHTSTTLCRVALLFMWSNLNAWCDSSVKFSSRRASFCFTHADIAMMGNVMEKGLQIHSSLPL